MRWLASGPPLILLHGLSGSGRWWSRNVPVFSRSFRTYSVDLPGFGESRGVRWSRLDDIADSTRRLARGRGSSASAYRRPLTRRSRGGAARRAPSRPHRPAVLVDAAIRPQGTRLIATAGACHAHHRPRLARVRAAAGVRFTALPSAELRRGDGRCAADGLGAASEADRRSDARRLGRAGRHHPTCARARDRRGCSRRAPDHAGGGGAQSRCGSAPRRSTPRCCAFSSIEMRPGR